MSIKLSIAPMMAWSNRHFRYFLRLIHPTVTLYTEMVTANALRYGPRSELLAFNPKEHPIVLQLGGCDPEALAKAAAWGQAEGYDAININVGCPSPRVQSGRFGVSLMREPALVARLFKSMQTEVDVPITVKTRIGVDHQDSFEFLCAFVDKVAAAGCRHFIIHARKAWLEGLSPRENRHIPPLNYERVYALKARYPELIITINGGIRYVEAVLEHQRHVDGVMLGRVICARPYLLADLARQEGLPVRTRQAVLKAYTEYTATQLALGVPLPRLLKPVLGLFRGQPGAGSWRRYLSEHMHKPGAGIEVLGGELPTVGQLPHCVSGTALQRGPAFTD